MMKWSGKSNQYATHLGERPSCTDIEAINGEFRTNEIEGQRKIENLKTNMASSCRNVIYMYGGFPTWLDHMQ
jgi:hypothetical protein